MTCEREASGTNIAPIVDQSIGDVVEAVVPKWENFDLTVPQARRPPRIVIEPQKLAWRRSLTRVSTELR
jgi:hypothetical protein